MKNISEKLKTKNAHFIEALKKANICFSDPAVLEQKQDKINAYIEMSKSENDPVYHYQNYDHLSYCYFVPKNNVAKNKSLSDIITNDNPYYGGNLLFKDDLAARKFHIDQAISLGEKEFHKIDLYHLKKFDVKRYDEFSYGLIKVPFWEVYFNYTNQKGKTKAYSLGYVKQSIFFIPKEDRTLYLGEDKEPIQEFVSQLVLPSDKFKDNIAAIVTTLIVLLGIIAFIIYVILIEK